jgi:YidC/Oxa1 family membrane protein insertase
MQSMDRNTIIGFVLLAGLLFAYLFFSSKGSQEVQIQKQRIEDSLARVAAQQRAIQAKKDAATAVNTPVVKDTTGFQGVINGTEKTVTVETDLLKIVFSNKGGQPKTVELKKYKSGKGEGLVKLMDSNTDSYSYRINTYPNQSADVAVLYFTEGGVTKNADGSQQVTYNLTGVNGETITHSYTVRKDDYKIDWNVKLNGADKLFSQGNFNLNWKLQLNQHESDKRYESTQTNICFNEGEEFDYIMTKDQRKFEKPVLWLGVAQQFFNSTIITKTPFASGDVSWTKETNDSLNRIATVTASVQTKLTGSVTELPLQLYFGPNDYKLLEKQAPEMSKMVNLGRDFYAFVRPINRYIIMPVFDFFKSFISSYGIVILLLTLFIRLLTSPLVYTSYLSGAKMKALRPELDIIKKRLGDDQQAFGMEQMKLFREAGVNPLGGCIPALLQIPIFFALYSFFNSNIALRGESFLWADNLASYDVIYKLPFSIPLNYGDHISLFTITAVATSFLISIYNMSMTPDQNNPMMKYMPYIFPFVLLFVFNSLPSALTWYYTVSNLITLVLQWVIQNYIIDHNKILSKIDENRKKPKKKSAWADRLEQVQEQQKRLQDAKNKGNKK